MVETAVGVATVRVQPSAVNGVVEIMNLPMVNGDPPNNVVRGTAATPSLRYGSGEDAYGITERAVPQPSGFPR